MRLQTYHYYMNQIMHRKRNKKFFSLIHLQLIYYQLSSTFDINFYYHINSTEI